MFPHWRQKNSPPPGLFIINEAYGAISVDVGAVGADGYQVSRDCAGKFVENLARSGALKHYAWKNYFYGIGEMETDVERHVSNIIRTISKPLIPL